MNLSKDKPMLIIYTILLETLFICIFNVKITLSQDINALKNFVPFANLIIVLLSGFALVSIRQLGDYTRRQTESRLLRDHLQHVEDLVNSLDIQRHEHTRHLQVLQSMLYLDEVDEAQEYLDGIAKHYWKNQGRVSTGHPAVTALLNSKSKVAEIKNIDFDFAIKCDINQIEVAPWDLCSIIGNLLDNAMEAAVEDEKSPQVNLEIKHENSYYVIYVYNSGARIDPARKKEVFMPGYTSKNSAARGFGLYLLQKLVDKYEGKIEVVCEPKTTFIIYLPDRGVKENDKKILLKNSREPGDASTGR